MGTKNTQQLGAQIGFLAQQQELLLQQVAAQVEQQVAALRQQTAAQVKQVSPAAKLAKRPPLATGLQNGRMHAFCMTPGASFKIQLVTPSPSARCPPPFCSLPGGGRGSEAQV